MAAGQQAEHFAEQQKRRVPDQRIDAFEAGSFVRHHRRGRDDAVKPDQLAEEGRQRQHGQAPSPKACGTARCRG
jgi:hypothetical protein